MKMLNSEIYTIAAKLIKEFDNNDQKLPIKVGFYLLKNQRTLLPLAQDIEFAKNNIIKQYGIKDEADSSQFYIPAEKLEQAQKELEDLSNLEQEVHIYTVNIDDFVENSSLTVAQMDALLFMIE